MKEQEEVEQYAHARSEVLERKKYLKTLYNSDNASQAIIDYCWSSRVRVPSNTDATTSALRRRVLQISYDERDNATEQLLAQPLPGVQFESPSVHGGKITGSLDKQYFPEDDEGQQPEDKDLGHGSSYASPKHLLILSKILESSDDVLASTEAGDVADPNDDRIWGHRDFKWNQLQILEEVFHSLVRRSEHASVVDDSSEPGLWIETGLSIGHVLKQAYRNLDCATQRMMTYTVFGSLVKRNNWELFSDLCSVGSGADAYVFSATDWLDLAVTAAFEAKVSRRKIRTNLEHTDFVQLETRLCRRRSPSGIGMQQSTESSVLSPSAASHHNQYSSSSRAGTSVKGQLQGASSNGDYARWFAAKSRAHLDDARRQACLARQLAVGDMVWSQVKLL
jgi:hypothetical protein